MITVQPIKEIDGDVEVTKVDDISLGTRIYDIIVLSDYNLKNVAVCKYVLLWYKYLLNYEPLFSIDKVLIWESQNNFKSLSEGKAIETQKVDNTVIKKNNAESHIIQEQNGEINLDTIGLYTIISSIIVVITLRILMRYRVHEEFEFLEEMYKWSNLAIERAFGATLPIYWLLRKEHSRAYAARKMNQFLDYCR